MIIFFASIALSIGYIYLLLWITNGWEKSYEYIDTNIAKVPVSIIIAARNESQNIRACLDSIKALSYPTKDLEVIIVDDQSDDDTAQIIKKEYPQFTLLHTSKNQTGKKAAIKLASTKASGEWLVFTDADCTVPKHWIQALLSNNKDHIKMVCAPIRIQGDENLISRFQALDNMATMAATANGINRKKYYSANGANMAIKRTTFLDLYQYRNDENIASGDDMFAIQSLAQHEANSIAYTKNSYAIVTTGAEKYWSGLYQQRKRWASKSQQYPDKNLLLVQGYVFVLVSVMLLHIILTFFGYGLSPFILAIMLALKLTMDYLFLNKLSEEFGDTESTKKFIISGLCYNIYILWAAWQAILPSSYKWKGRDQK